MADTNFIFTQPQSDNVVATTSLPPWHVLIVDDDESIHQITALVLRGFLFEQRPLKLWHAYSAAQASHILTEQSDIALAIIDVVMETNHAGLDLVKRIRTELGLSQIRLILRTGQPGEAPEESVIRDYDINDYKNKTEVTAIRLKTLIYAGLRSYRDLGIIHHHRLGLEKIIAATVSFLECDSLSEFASLILQQVAHLLGMDHQTIFCCVATGASAATPKDELAIIAAHGQSIQKLSDLPNEVQRRLQQVHQQQHSYHGEDCFVGFFTTNRGLENLLYVEKGSVLTPAEHHLLTFFASHIAVAYENIRLRELIKESQRELSYILGEAVEQRSKETGSHVKRVAHFSYLLAIHYGLPPYVAEKIKLASPLHDVGKIAIPDHILNKPGKHTPDEWRVMQTHAEIGYQMLCHSHNEILQQGAIIAQQHHERWDGTGYPQRLAGEAIDIAGRITALADVFDALASERCYKPAWPMPKVLAYLAAGRGQQFDPTLTDILLTHIDEFIKIRDSFPDPTTLATAPHEAPV
jgi:response regulator RpfG family c-di-GMP phosphodiesterase